MIRTFADYVISKQAELSNLGPEDVYSDRDILVQFFTLLMAGAVSTGFTSSWAFFYLGINYLSDLHFDSDMILIHML